MYTYGYMIVCVHDIEYIFYAHHAMFSYMNVFVCVCCILLNFLYYTLLILYMCIYVYHILVCMYIGERSGRRPKKNRASYLRKIRINNTLYRIYVYIKSFTTIECYSIYISITNVFWIVFSFGFRAWPQWYVYILHMYSI